MRSRLFAFTSEICGYGDGARIYSKDRLLNAVVLYLRVQVEEKGFMWGGRSNMVPKTYILP